MFFPKKIVSKLRSEPLSLSYTTKIMLFFELSKFFFKFFHIFCSPVVVVILPPALCCQIDNNEDDKGQTQGNEEG